MKELQDRLRRKGGSWNVTVYDCPGNVRELKNVIEYAVAMSDKDVITEDLILRTAPTLPRHKCLVFVCLCISHCSCTYHVLIVQK